MNLTNIVLNSASKRKQIQNDVSHCVIGDRAVVRSGSCDRVDDSRGLFGSVGDNGPDFAGVVGASIQRRGHRQGRNRHRYQQPNVPSGRNTLSKFVMN